MPAKKLNIPINCSNPQKATNTKARSAGLFVCRPAALLSNLENTLSNFHILELIYCIYLVKSALYVQAWPKSPLLIIGAGNIAKALGLSPEHVKNALVGQADFPARKYNRKWAVTRQPGADPETLQAEFLDPLGVSSEAFQEALDNDTDVQGDLHAAPQVMNHPLTMLENLMLHWDLAGASGHPAPQRSSFTGQAGIW